MYSGIKWINRMGGERYISNNNNDIIGIGIITHVIGKKADIIIINNIKHNVNAIAKI